MPRTPVVLLAHVPHRSAAAAFDAAVRQAAFRAARLVIINATKGESLEDPQLAPYDQLRDLVERAREAGVDAEAEQPVGPEVETMILNRAHTLPVELIVLGTRRRSTVGKLFLGSTAQRVLTEADCEVLLVKGRGESSGLTSPIRAGTASRGTL